ncbi:hypothetical protein [Mesorhizobium sp. M0578]|uniref:hypothetical protein n=1 Tax=unclassified Mesorhizobium TaxID=325217 RepID=UPI00333D0E77
MNIMLLTGLVLAALIFVHLKGALQPKHSLRRRGQSIERDLHFRATTALSAHVGEG